MNLESARTITKRVFNAQEKIADPELVVIPVEQLADIYSLLLSLLQLGKATISEWMYMPDGEQKVRHKVFQLADFGAVFAGQWLPKEIRERVREEHANG